MSFCPHFQNSNVQFLFLIFRILGENNGKKWSQIGKGLKGAPLSTLKEIPHFFSSFFFSLSTFIKKIHLIPIQDFCFKCARNKKERNCSPQALSSSNCTNSAKFFPMLVETPYFGVVINPKTYVNHELGSKLFFLISLAYKLVNLLVFEK